MADDGIATAAVLHHRRCLSPVVVPTCAQSVLVPDVGIRVFPCSLRANRKLSELRWGLMRLTPHFTLSQPGRDPCIYAAAFDIPVNASQSASIPGERESASNSIASHAKVAVVKPSAKHYVSTKMVIISKFLIIFKFCFNYAMP